MSIFGAVEDPLVFSYFHVIVDRNSPRFGKNILIGMTINQAREVVEQLQKDIKSKTKPFSGLILSVGKHEHLNPITGCLSCQEARQI